MFICTSYGGVFFLSSWPAMCIHGDKAQAERDWVLSGESHTRFKEKGSCFSVVCLFLPQSSELESLLFSLQLT